jgi:hypothetical protein
VILETGILDGGCAIIVFPSHAPGRLQRDGGPGYTPLSPGRRTSGGACGARYFFDVHGETFANPDLVGRDLVDDDAARAEAHQLAKEVVVAELTGGLPEKTWVEVVDEDQRPILLMPIDEAPAGPTRHV